MKEAAVRKALTLGNKRILKIAANSVFAAAQSSASRRRWLHSQLASLHRHLGLGGQSPTPGSGLALAFPQSGIEHLSDPSGAAGLPRESEMPSAASFAADLCRDHQGRCRDGGSWQWRLKISGGRPNETRAGHAPVPTIVWDEVYRKMLGSAHILQGTISIPAVEHLSIPAVEHLRMRSARRTPTERKRHA